MNDTDPVGLIPPDQCLSAMNVEFWLSALGERRAGCVAMSLNGSGLNDGLGIHSAAIVHISERFPTNDPNVGEVWTIGAIEGSASATAYRTNEAVWMAVTPDDAWDNTIPNIYRIIAQGWYAKHFFAGNTSGSVDRLHLWDGTNLRRAGQVPPAAAPTAVDEGGGTFAGIRYYRVRYAKQDGSGKTVIRSEPSAVKTFTPSGTGAGATITKPAASSPFERETHWEIEASGDNANFYVLVVLAVGTTTYNDTTSSPGGYASPAALSDPIGTYLLQPNAEYLLLDEDRLIMTGHFTDKSQGSRVSWTPPFAEPTLQPLLDSSERITLNTLEVSHADLDNYEGGDITGVSKIANGSFYIFKWSHIYQATRTNSAGNTASPTPAYDIVCISKSRGALPGSGISGADEYGQACIYFLDPLIGPSRLGVPGLQLVRGLRKTWTRVNRLATGVTAHGVYYPEKRQVWWWVAADSSNYPTLGLKLQVNETTEAGTTVEVARGWSLFDGRIAQAYCSAIINVEIRDALGDVATIARRPYIGLTAPDLLQQCDLLSTDAGQAYVAQILTRPYMNQGILNKWGAMVGALLTDVPVTVGQTLTISVIRDFGVEGKSVPIVLTVPTAQTPGLTVSQILTLIDNLSMSSTYALQFLFSD